MKKCSLPSTDYVPLEWMAGVNYAVNDVVKVGPSLFIAVGTGGINRVMWIAYRYGASVDASMGQVRLKVNATGGGIPIDSLEVTAPLTNPDLIIALASSTTSKNTPEKIGAAIAALAVGSDAAAVAIRKIESISFNLAWRDNPPGNPGGTATEDFVAQNKYYKCIAVRAMGDMNKYTGLFPQETAAYAPEDQGYFTEISSLTRSESAADRSWCKTENPVESTRCKRCGNEI